ncbi:hypothetical protein IWW36_001905 [Coemansia brasiliensis]|uniref:Kinetochore protein mis13 n=1 Tax=Coemansia brasiliensis TaxID=2650707 RepID=A0A9W8M0E5_9FUNG|nr:hypothetical protein IWW36_001905 [Coemansia brasiliensis]
MMIAKTLNCENDHGFIFKRGRPSAAVKAIGAIASQPTYETPSKRPAAPLHKSSSQLDFPEPKRRLTSSPSQQLDYQEELQDISVPIRKPPQPTPLISRTRMRQSMTPQGKVQQRRKSGGRRATAAVPHRRMSRKATLGKRRRSTFSMRGKRASSIGGGFKAMPHDAVDASDFYRHISPEMPEPIRLRQLLAWCARKTAQVPEWPKELPSHVAQLLSDAAREAVDDIHSAFERGEIATSWYHRPVDSEEQLKEDDEVQPHPENRANEEAKEKLLARIAKLQAENEAWMRELKRAGAEHAKCLDRLPKPVQSLAADSKASDCEPIARALSSIDWSPVLQENSNVSDYIEDANSGAISSEIASAEEQIDRATRDIEVQLDAVHLDMHCAYETHKHAVSRCNKYRRDLGFIFEQRRERALAVASSVKTQIPNDASQPSQKPAVIDPTHDLLRTLASTLSKQ